MAKCVECGGGKSNNRCCNCNAWIHGNDDDSRWCYYTPENHGGEMVWCRLCHIAQENGELIEGVRPDNDDGHYTARCKMCNKPLNDDESISRGYGPDCWRKVNAES